MSHVVACAAYGVVVLQRPGLPAQDARRPDDRMLLEMLVIPQGDLEKIADRPVLDRDLAVNVRFGHGQRRVDHEPDFPEVGRKTQRATWHATVAKLAALALAVDQRQRTLADDPG
jgi:hypothetical protein